MPTFLFVHNRNRRKQGRCALRGDMFSTRKKEETQTDREDGEHTNTPQITLTTSSNSRPISTSQDQSRTGDAATSSGRNPTRPPPRPPRPTREVLLNVSAGINSGQQKEADPKRKLSLPPPIRRYQSEGQFASQAVNKSDEGRSQSEIKPRSFHDADPTLRLSQWDLISLEMQHGVSPRYFRPQDRVPSRYIFH